MNSGLIIGVPRSTTSALCVLTNTESGKARVMASCTRGRRAATSSLVNSSVGRGSSNRYQAAWLSDMAKSASRLMS